jgi:hypothetical protein
MFWSFGIFTPFCYVVGIMKKMSTLVKPTDPQQKATQVHFFRFKDSVHNGVSFRSELCLRRCNGDDQGDQMMSL